MLEQGLQSRCCTDLQVLALFDDLVKAEGLQVNYFDGISAAVRKKRAAAERDGARGSACYKAQSLVNCVGTMIGCDHKYSWLSA